MFLLEFHLLHSFSALIIQRLFTLLWTDFTWLKSCSSSEQSPSSVQSFIFFVLMCTVLSSCIFVPDLITSVWFSRLSWSDLIWSFELWRFVFLWLSVGVALLCSFLLGLGDSCFNTQLLSIIGFMFRDNSAPAFAAFKFIQVSFNMKQVQTGNRKCAECRLLDV